MSRKSSPEKDDVSIIRSKISRRKAFSTAAKVGAAAGLGLVLGGVGGYLVSQSTASPATVTTTVTQTVERTEVVTPTAEVKLKLFPTRDEIVNAAKREGHVTVVGFGSTAEHDFYRRMGEEFSKRYGISFEYQDVGWFKAVEQISEEKRRGVEEGSIDVVMIWSAPFAEGYKNGIWWDIPLVDLVPNARTGIPYIPLYFHDFYHSYGRHIPILQWQVAMLYNKQWVNAGKMDSPPKTMDELMGWLRNNKGKFAYCDPNKGGSGHTWLISVAYYVNGYDVYAFKPFDENLSDNLAKPVWQYLNEMEQYLYPDNPYPEGNKATIELLELEEVGLQPMWTSITFQEIQAGRLDPEIAGMYMIDPPIASGGFDGYAIPFNAPNKFAALLWIDYMLSDEVQRRIPVEIGAYPIKTDAMPSKVTWKDPASGKEIDGVGVWLPAGIDFRDWRNPLKKPELRFRHAEYMFDMMKKWITNVQQA